MHIHSKQRTGFITVLLLAMVFNAAMNAQNMTVVSVNTIMLGPPYSVPFDQLKEKLRVTVLSNSSMEGVYLTMMIRGDNGVVIQSNGNQYDQFYVQAGTPVVLPGTDQNFDIIFQQQNLSFSNVDPSVLYDYGLPPGNYQVCFRLWNPFGIAGPVPLSPDAPAGCADFSIIQSGMNISTVFRPPFNADFTEYYDRTMVTLTSTQYNRVNLQMTLKGNNGITIRTSPRYRPAVPLTVEPNVPVLLTGQDLWDYFNPDNLVFNGILKQEVVSRGLPEGTYRLCFRVYDLNGEPVTGDDPAGCSAPFSLRLLEPPVILSPRCGEEIKHGPSQPVIFSWTPSPGAPPGTPYTLRIVQMDNPDVPPGDALLTATTPAFFEESVLGTSFLYGPAQPVLEPGKKYAFEVIAGLEALNINNLFDYDASKLRFKNKGRSAPCYFEYGPQSVSIPGIIGQISQEEPAPEYNSITPDPEIVPYATVSGQLNYKFKGANTTFTLTGSAQSLSSGDQNNPSSQTGNDQGPQSLQSSANYGVVNTSTQAQTQNVMSALGYIDPEGSFPLGNVRVSLVVHYVMRSGTINGKDASGKVIGPGSFPLTTDDEYNSRFPGDGMVLQTTTTASDGSFSFNFIIADTTLGKTQDLSIIRSGEFGDMANGKVYKTVRLMVDNKYYCSPDVDIFIKPWKNADLGTLVSWVKSYNLMVNVKSTTAQFYDQSAGSGHPLNDVKTSILREGTVAGVPYNEGSIKNKLPAFAGQKKTVESTNTNGKGQALFTRLVMHDPDNNNDRYYILCKTSSTSGGFNYKDKEKRYSPVYLNDKKNFPFNSLATEMVSGGGGGEGVIDTGPQYVEYGSAITFNSEFTVRTYQLDIEMNPKLPRVYGQAFATGMKDLVNLSNTMSDTTMAGVKILLFSQYDSLNRVPDSENIKGTLSIKSTWTDANGFYSFENLPLEIDFSGWKAGEPSTYKGKIEGPHRWMLAKPKGFGLWQKNLNVLKYGDQVKADVMLYPDGIALGYVVDEEGRPVKSSVKVEGYPAVKTGQANFITSLILSGANVQGMDQVPPKAQMFVFYAPSSNDARVTILPDNISSYAPLDTSMRIAKKKGNGEIRIKKYTVKQLMHRVRFRVVGYARPPGILQLPPSPLKGVKVRIGNILQEVSGVTDEWGYVTLNFVHSDNKFDLEVIPPENSDYPVYPVEFTSTPGTEVVFVKEIRLYPGYHIAGKVTIGDNDQPVDSAKVSVEGKPEIFAFTKADGSYELRKIPGEMKICAIKAEKYDPGKAIIGDKKENIALPASSAVDLHLTVETGMPTTLFGFPVTISSVDQQDNTAVISGALAEPTEMGNADFRFRSGDIPEMKFAGVRLSRNAATEEFKPQDNSVDLDKETLDLVIHDAFLGVQHPASGSLIRLEADNNGKGVIRGKVELKNSFSFNSSLFAFKDHDAWLASEGTPETGITVFRAPPDDENARTFGLVSSAGDDLKVSLKGFDGVAKKAGSYLRKDTLSLALELTTGEIPNIHPSKISIDIGDLKLTNAGFEPVEGTKTLSFALEQWTVEAEKWSFSQQSSGFNIESGTLKTGLADLPVKNIELTPNSFKIWEVEIKQMALAGVAPLKLETTNTSFGYFPSVGKDQKGHWRLAVVGLQGQPAVTLEGLPGLKSGTSLSFSTFSVLSNGEQSLTFTQGTQQLEFYNTLHVAPISIYPYNGYFLLYGAMDLGIPRISKQNGNIKFSKEGSAIKFELYPLNMDFEGPGKVRFYSSQKSGDQVFDNGVFAAPGTIIDEEGIKLKGVLHRDKTSCWLQVDPLHQVIPIGMNGKTNLSDVQGEMRVDASKNDWGLFSFSGTMNGVKGMEGDRKKTFTIYGDIVADNQDVEVKNIDTGFGNLNITFDYKHARMIGDMDINKSFAGLTMHGVANMLVDGSGWYFLAGGQIGAPGLGDFQAGFMIGDYDFMPPDVTGKLMQFAYNKEIPAAFSNHISGMFITGRKSLPIIDIPDVSIDLWILSARLGVDAGLDARLWMGFDDTGNEYGVGAMAFAHAYFIASSITCTSLSADTRAEMGAKGVYNTGTGAFSIGGCGSFSLAARIEQCFPTLVAGCEGCIGKTLSESIRVNMLLDSQGHTDLSFGFGSCSGQNNLSSGF